MPVSATIDGNPVVIQRGSLSIEKRIEERSVASFLVEDITGTENFVRGMPVEVYDSDVTLLYGGFIHLPQRQRKGAIGPNLLHNILCIDNHYLADKRIVVKSYTGKTLKYIVEDIVTDYLADEGITIGEIQTGPIIKSAIFNYVKASDCFDALKELSGFIWYIDELKKLYFIDRATNTAPWNMDSVVHRPIKGSVYLETGNPLYRNRQYIRGGKGVTSVQTEIFTGDGVTVAFTVGYSLALEPSGDNGSVSVTGRDPVLQTVGIKGLETDQDCYWNKGDATITFDTAPENTETVTIVYYGQYPLIIRADSYIDILARQAVEGGTGIVEEITTEAYHESADAMRESAKAKIKEFCRNAEKFVYETTESGLAPGQIQEITYSPFGFSAHEMLIESVIITSLGDLTLYNVTAMTGPRLGSWAKFFAGIFISQDAQIKIGDSELLALLLQYEDLDLVEATDLHSDAFPPDVSRWIAEPPMEVISEIHKTPEHVRHEALALAEATDINSEITEFYKWG